MSIARTLGLVATTGLLTSVASAQTVLSEVRIDEPGADNNEYFEIRGTPGTSLAGLTLIVIGDGTAAQGSGVIEVVVPLTGTIPASGYFVVAEPTFAIGTADLTIPGANGLNFENSDNVTFVLVSGFTGSNNQDLDTNDDGILDITPWASVLDAVGLVLSDFPPPAGVEWAYGPQLGGVNVGPDGTFVPGHVFRCGDGSTWAVGLFDIPPVGYDTPGSANPACPGLSVALGVQKSAPAAVFPGMMFDYTITVFNSASGPAANVQVVDNLPAGVTFLGQSSDPPITFTGTPPNLSWNAGTVTVGNPITITVTVMAGSVGSVSNTATVSTTTPGDDPDNNTSTVVTSIGNPPKFGMVINEIHADPSTTEGDANGDGVISATNDEFVELVNGTANPMDISGYTLADDFGVRHVFPGGTVVNAGCAIVVFGGGTPTGSFGGSIVQVASTGALGLNNTGDTVSFGFVDVVASYAYGSEGNNDNSLTRSPDVTGSDPLIPHITAPGSGGTRFSPGTKVGGSSFDCGAACPADLNGDGVVGAADLGILLGSWGAPGCGGSSPCPADLSGDGAVGPADLGALLGSWGPCTSNARGK